MQLDINLRKKFNATPIRPIQVVRSHLLDCFNPSHRITLISAPAGYGKTTLARDFLQAMASREPAARGAWFSIEAEDNESQRFFVNFIAALQTAVPTVGKTGLALLQTPQAPLQAVLAHITNDVEDLQESFFCVLDDYHLIDSSPIHQALIDLIDHSPSNLHLIFTTRVDPPFPLARWRVRHQLTEFRADDLRFNNTETEAFLNRVMGLHLSQDHIAMLETRTEGWVAALQLAGLSLQKRADASTFVADFAGNHRYILDFLMEEVWKSQPVAIQDFLLKTSILKQLSAPLCAAVLGDETSHDTAAMLDELERANLFLFPLDAERQWYRYHQMFAEMLQTQLHRLDPDLVPVLHRRAGLWFEQMNDMHAAVQHALDAKDFERAANLIETGTPWWVRNEVGTISRWQSSMPEEVIQARPRLMLNRIWSLLSGSRYDEAEVWLTSLERNLEAAAVHLGSWRIKLDAEVLAIKSSIARHRQQNELAIRYGQQALELMPADPSDLRAVVALHLGNAYLLQCDLGAATQTLEQAVDTSQAAGHSFVYLSAQHSLALIHLMRGQLHAAESMYLQSQRYVQCQSQSVLSGLEAVGLTEIYREWNDFKRAETILMEGLSLAQQGGSAAQIRLAYMAGARLKQSQRMWSEAELYLDRAAQLTFEENSVNAFIIVISRARLALMRGNPEEAQRWLKGLAKFPNKLEFVHDLEIAAQTRSWLAMDNHTAARKLLNEWLACTEKNGRIGRALEAKLLLSVSDWKRGHHNSAQKLIGEVLVRAAPEGYINLFVEEGAPMYSLLNAFSQQAQPSLLPYLQKILMAFPTVDSSSGLPPTLADVLTDREIEILRLLAEGYSYRQVAQRALLAFSTVQSYIRVLYRKLGAHSGREAVARARALNLIT